MENLSASDAKREFGEVLLKVQKEPVGINRNGKPVAVMVSVEDFNRFQLLKEACLKAELAKGVASLERGDFVDGDSFFNDLLSKVDDESV